MHDDSSDAALWLEAVSGTEASFATLFDRYRTRVFRKAYARVRRVADAEDIVATVFLEAWRSRKKVRIVEGSILPWLLTVTTYVALNQERSTRRYRRLLAALPIPQEQPDHAEDVTERLDEASRSIEVHQAMAGLSLADQTILDLCIIEELPLPSVAMLLDIPVGTVKSRLHRARGKLRQRLTVGLGSTTCAALFAQAEGTGR